MSGLRRYVLPLIASFSVAATARTQDTPAIARFVPPTPDPRHVFVLDSAHILSAETIAALQDSARALQSETRADVAWVTLPTLGGRPIEQAALYIGRTWRIGSPGQPGDPLRNRGLVVLYVPDKTKTAGPNFRIEVGNGLEGTITDSRSRAITAAMRDDLRAKRYDAAYTKGWAVAARLVRDDFVAAGSPAAVPAPVSTPASGGSNEGRVIMAFLVLFGAIFVIVVILAAKRRGTRPLAKARAARRRRHSVDHHLLHDDADARRRLLLASMVDMQSSASSSGDNGGGDSGSSSSSDGGSTGGGGGFSGGGSSDTI